MATPILGGSATLRKRFVKRFKKSLVATVVAMFLLLAMTPSIASAEIRDDLWSDDFWLRGFDARIEEGVEDGAGNFYVSGSFSAIDGQPFRHVAMWNGSSWSNVGSGLARSPYAMAADGQGGIIAVGYGDLLANEQSTVVRWDGATWSTLSTGLATDLFGREVVVRPNGEIVVSFDSEVGAAVMSWDGSQWSELFVTDQRFHDGIRFAFDADGTLYTAGSNGVSVGDPTSDVHSLEIEQLIVDDAGVLYAYGKLPYDGGETFPDDEMWVWDGASWTLTFTEWPSRVLSLDQTGQLISTSGREIERWDGNNWTTIVEIEVDGLGFVSTYGDGLVAMGYFSRAGDVDVDGLALWQGGTWQAMHGSTTGLGLLGSVTAGAVDSSGNLFVGGDLRSAGDLELQGGAYWDGGSWTALPDPFYMQSLVVTTNGLLVAESGGLWQWNGNEWQELGGQPSGWVRAIAADGLGGVIVSGVFDELPDGTPVNGIARWNGQKWEALGDGIDFAANEIAADDQGNIFVDGYWPGQFRQWDGSSWITHADNALLYDMTFDTNGALIATGEFGPGRTNLLAQWTGEMWVPNTFLGLRGVPLQARFNPCGQLVLLTTEALHRRIQPGEWETLATVTGGRDVVFSGRDVYVTGHQLTAGGVVQSGVARWTDPGLPSISEAESVAGVVGSCDYDATSHGDVLRLYRAFFNREPDVDGAKYWIDINAQDQTLDQIADYFTLGQEFANNYEGTTDREYLEAVYRNVLGREYDQAGFDYWLTLLESGELTRGGVVRWIAANQEFINRFPYQP